MSLRQTASETRLATSTDEDDRPLVEAAQADSGRFVELYDRYVHRVYAFAVRRVGDRAAAEDVTSEVFERALTNLARFEWRGTPFGSWLFRIASNVIADRWQESARESHDEPPDVSSASSDDVERRAMVFQLVGRLPAAQRRVIEMRFVEGKSIRDIAAALRRSEGAVKQLQLRALENLRKSMGHHG
jgi:RNA polymerase sigma-70 factor, ECF subfamily